MKPSVVGGSSDALRSSYEDLRAQVLAGGRGPGFALFLRSRNVRVDGSLLLVYRGRCCHSNRSRQPTTLNCCRRACDPEIVAILAGMLLEKQWEVTR